MSDSIIISSTTVTNLLVSDPEVVSVVSSIAQGPPGPPGPGVADKLVFSYGDASPAGIVLIPSNKVVYQVQILLLTPFDGEPSTLTVGDAGDNARLFSANEIDLTSEGTYISSPNHKYLSDTQTNLYIILGAGVTQGNGVIFLFKT